MQIAFAIIAALTLVSAIAAMTLRNLVHCALCLAITFAGIAALYLQLGAAFVGWAQVLVYIGAVAILIVFAILLTSNSADATHQPTFSRFWGVGVVVAIAVFGVLAHAIMASPLSQTLPAVKGDPTVREIGNQLMTRYVLPLEAIGLLLTAAAIGAVILGMKEIGKEPTLTPHPPGEKPPGKSNETSAAGNSH